MHPERTKSNWVGFKTLVAKEIRRILRIWVQTLVPPVIQMTLYFLIFGYVIGSRVGHMGGFKYMAYIAPGLIMMSVITNSYSNVVSSFFGAKFARHIEELLVSPLPNVLILLGYMAGGMFRGLLVGTVVAVVASLLTSLPLMHPLVVITSVLLTSAVFSLGGFINAVFATKFDDISIIPNFVLTPLNYLGGVFYSISVLPPIWRHATRVDPILYMINAFRFGFLGESDIPLWEAYILIVAFLFILFAVSLMLLKRGTGLKA